MYTWIYARYNAPVVRAHARLRGMDNTLDALHLYSTINI